MYVHSNLKISQVSNSTVRSDIARFMMKKMDELNLCSTMDSTMMRALLNELEALRKGFLTAASKGGCIVVTKDDMILTAYSASSYK